jgi:hypothetical protein
MSAIPLDLERGLEQRCAARYLRPSELAATPRHPPERQDQQPTADRRIDPTASGLFQRGERGTEVPPDPYRLSSIVAPQMMAALRIACAFGPQVAQLYRGVGSQSPAMLASSDVARSGPARAYGTFRAAE